MGGAGEVVTAQGTKVAERSTLENLVKRAKKCGHAHEKGWSPLRQEGKGRQKMSHTHTGEILDLGLGTNSFRVTARSKVSPKDSVAELLQSLEWKKGKHGLAQARMVSGVH